MKTTFFKIVAVIILATILVAISIIKSSISDKTSASLNENQLEQYFQSRDSLLLRQFDDTTRFYIDSLINQEDYFNYQIDSLNDYFRLRESTIVAERVVDTILIRDTIRVTKYKTSPPTKKKPTSTAKKTNNTVSTKVKDEYSAIYARLPKDLTDYEEKVSRNEIIVELSKKYKISPKTVKKYIK